MSTRFLRLSEIDESPVDLERSIELPELRGGDGRRLIPRSVRLGGEARRGSAGVELHARWTATVQLQCSRCLEPYERVLNDRFFLILVHAAVEFGLAEQELRPEDAALLYVEGERADLGEIVSEQIQLSLPLKPLCEEDCAGLCPTCGANRKRIECGCSRVELDPRLAPLLELRDRLGRD